MKPVTHCFVSYGILNVSTVEESFWLVFEFGSVYNGIGFFGKHCTFLALGFFGGSIANFVRCFKIVHFLFDVHLMMFRIAEK
jgi:hypothetical protein